MSRELRKADIDKVADIWLDTNIRAHDFIPAQYWESNYEDDQGIQGFIGLNDEYIEGIFVSDGMQSQGIGRLLLNYAKTKRNELRLNVYRKNTRAIAFYQREGFKILCSGIDEATGEKDHVMEWRRK